MDVWTLTHGEVTKSLADWGMSNCVISEPSFNAGRFTATIAGDMTATVPWVEKDSVIIRRGDVVEFRGTMLNIPRQGDGPNESITFEAVDPWWWLGQGAYSQNYWDIATLSAVQASRVALFAAVTAGTGWSPRSIGAEIAAIIAHCDAYHGGGKMQLGTLSGDGFDIMPVPQRMESLPHESALRRALQWVPDAVPSWDHRTDPPTLNITQRAAATARDYVFCDGEVMMSQQIVKRQDLAVRGVRIIYSGVDELGNQKTVVDAAGASSGTGVVETVIDLAGGAGGGAPSAPTVQPAVEQKYSVKSIEFDPTDRSWLFEHGDVGVSAVTDFVVLNAVMQFDPDAPENAGHGSLGGCTRHWLSGGVPQSMASSHTRRAVVVAKIGVHFGPETVGDLENATATRNETRILRIHIPTTDLNGNGSIEVSPESITMGGGAGGAIETYPPTGVAEKLLEAWSQPQHEGALRITREECNEAVRPGDVVNWTGSLAAWETMNAQVKQLTRNIDTGTTDITLGVADHLALDEFAQLLKVMSIKPALDLQQQSEGTTPTAETDATQIDQLVNPGATFCSQQTVLNVYEYITSAIKFKFDAQTATHTHTNTDTGEKVTHSPAGVTVESTIAESSNKIAPNVTTLEKDHYKWESTAMGLKLTSPSGNKIELNFTDGLKISKSGSPTLKLHPDTGLTLEEGGQVSKYTLRQMKHDDGDGNTNTITETEMEIMGSAGTGLYEASELSFEHDSTSVSLGLADVLQADIDGDTLSAQPSAVRMESGSDVMQIAPGSGLLIEHDSDSAVLDASHLIIEVGDDSAEMSPAGGFEAISEGYTAHLSPGDGLHLEGPGGGIVDLATKDGETISLMDTDMCADDGSQNHAWVLRGEETPV